MVKKNVVALCMGIILIHVSLITIGDTWNDSMGNTWSYYSRTGEASIRGVVPAVNPLSIPAYINGLRVTTIGQSAFEYCQALVGHVVIPEGVQYIDAFAFEHCNSMTSLSIPGSVKTIQDQAFAVCTNLEQVFISEGVETISPYAFGWCPKLRSIELPCSLQTLGSSVFCGCVSLENLVVGEGVSSIPYQFIKGCDKIENLILPASVSSLSYCALYHNQNLKHIIFLGGDKELSVDFGGAGSATIIRRKRDGSVPSPKVMTEFVSCDNPVIRLSATDDAEIFYSLTHWPATEYDTKYLNGIPVSDSVVLSAIAKKGSAYSDEVRIRIPFVAGEVVNGNERIRYKYRQSFGEMESVRIAEGVMELCDDMFEGCVRLRKVILPKTLVRATSGIFDDCPNLIWDSSLECRIVSGWVFGARDSFAQKIEIDVGVWGIADGAFLNNQQVQKVLIPNSVRLIGSDAFRNCCSIDDVVIPDSVETIGVRAFSECTGLTSVRIGNGLSCIGNSVFKDCFSLENAVLGEGVKTVGVQAFANDFCLDNVMIPDSVEEIADGAFSNCTELTSIAFGDGLKRVGNSAFENCISLEHVIFPEGLTSLGSRAFAGPSRLKSVSLPLSLECVGDEAFKGSVYITGVTVPTHLKTMRELFPDSYEKIETVVIPDGELVIIDSMFAGCSSLNSVVIPNSVTNIGSYAFECCGALQEIGMPDSVKTLGAAAFLNCRQLKNVALSKGLTAIADRTFELCISLDSLVIPSSVRSLGSRIFCGYWFPEGYGVINGSDRELRKTSNGDYHWYYYMQALTGIYYLGDAPEVKSDTYEGMPSALTSYVIKGSRGWYIAGAPTLPPDGWPTSGNARPITYWSPNEFDVTFDGNGGTPDVYYAKQITDTTYSLPKTNPTRDGYLFDGWWTEKTAGAQVYWNSRVTATKAHTLYAHWRALSDGITVVFNPTGGTVDPAEMTFPAGVTYGSLPVPTKIGHIFLGWYTSPSGGTWIQESSEVSKENNELYAHWTPIKYVVRYNANGGTGSMFDQAHTYNVKQKLSRNAFYNRGYAFLGWATSAGGAVVYANEKEVENLAELQGQVVNLYAVWNVASYSVRFDANGGYGWMDNQTFAIDASQAIAKCTLTREGYVFAGWATTWNGKVAYVDEQVVKNLTTIKNSTVVLYAVWRENSVAFIVGLDAQGGVCAETERSYERGQAIGSLPTPARSKYKFDGWYTAPSGGTKVTPSTKVTADVTYYAHWIAEGGSEQNVAGLVNDVMPVTVSSFAATTYDGYLYDEELEQCNVVGTIQVKAAKTKASKKSGSVTSKLTISIQLANETKKVSITGDYDLVAGGEQTFSKNGQMVTLLLGSNGIAGTFGGYVIEGVPNIYLAKDAQSKAAASAADATYVGSYNIISDEGSFAVTIAKKGKVKVTGSTSAGKAVNASAQLIVGANIACVPIMLPKVGLAFTVWLGDDSSVDGLSNAVIGPAGTLRSGARFSLDASELAKMIGDSTYADYFPTSISVSQSGTKWIVADGAKAGKVVLNKAKTGVDEVKLGGNPSALKLTYTVKTGVFKGSFKAYINANGKPKALSATVSGVLINGVGYGTATTKKYGSVGIEIR